MRNALFASSSTLHCVRRAYDRRMTVRGENADRGKAGELKLRSSVRCLLLTDILGRETSSTKPELHNELHCFQRRTEPRPQVSRTENLVKFGHTAFKVRERTDRQAYRHADRSTSHTWRGEVKIGNEAALGHCLGGGITLCHVNLLCRSQVRAGSCMLGLTFIGPHDVGRHCSTTIYYDLQQIFSECEFTFTFAICCRPSICLSSVVCNARAPVRPTQAVVNFDNFSTAFGTLAIR